jgi:iron donor protein CyaY
VERTRFEQLADACLERFATWLEDFDPDEVDFSSADGVIVLEFAGGKRFVLNRQGGASQMWFAAGARAWHYDWNGTAWVDDRDGHALDARIVEVVSAKLGHPVPPID